MLLGNWFLNEPADRFAAPYLYRWRQLNAPEPRVRFIDFSHLYEIGSGRVSASDLNVLIQTALNLEKGYRPAVIGIDLPLIRAEKGANQVIYSTAPGARELLSTIRNLDQRLPVIIGVESFRLTTDLENVVPGSTSRLASAFTYAKNDLTVMAFGDGDRAETFPTMGIALAQEAHRMEGDYAGVGNLMQPRHLVTPPEEWKQEALPAPKWMNVDYSCLAQREDLTVVPGQHLTYGDRLTPANIFAPADLEILKSDGKSTVWLVGIATVPEAEDTFTYDDEYKWAAEAEPLRRVYQHGAIAHTFLDRPLIRLDHRWDMILDLLCGFGTFLFTVVLERKFPTEKNGELWRSISKLIVVSVALVGACLVSFGLAYIGIFWFGFAGTAFYALCEGYLGDILESTKEEVSVKTTEHDAPITETR